LLPEKQLPLADLPPGGNIYWLKITNACGDTVRTICDEGCNDPVSIAWDGLDDTGLRVVEGLYKMVLDHAEGLISQDLVLIHDYHEWDSSQGGHHALTDGNGEFLLPDDCLGFGHMVTTTDEYGNTIDDRPIERLVNLRAVDGAGNVARRDSILFPTGGNLEVNFVIED